VTLEPRQRGGGGRKEGGPRKDEEEQGKFCPEEYTPGILSTQQLEKRGGRGGGKMGVSWEGEQGWVKKRKDQTEKKQETRLGQPKMKFSKRSKRVPPGENGGGSK